MMRHLSGPLVWRSDALATWSAVSERRARAALDRAGEAGVDAGQRPGVGDAVGGRDLGGAHARGCSTRRPRSVNTHDGAPSALPSIVSGPMNCVDQRRHGRVGLRRRRPTVTSGATRCCCSSGRPIQNSRPSGPAISSAKKVPRLLPRDPAHDLADEPPVGGGVVAVGGARLPDGGLRLEGADHRIPGERLLEGERGVDVGQAGLVAEQPAHRDVRLAGGLELGPVGGDRRVDVELAALGQEVGARRRGALGGGEHELQRVLGVRACPCPRSATPPQRSTTLRPPT